MTNPAAPPGRRWRLLPPLFLLAEVLLAIGLFQLIGWWTVLVLLALSALGLVVIGTGSQRAWRDIREMRRTGVAPERTAGDAALTLVAGLLLLFPGLLSGVLGLLLLLPFTRGLVRRTAGAVLSRKVLGAMGVRVHPGAGGQVFGDVVAGEKTTRGGRDTYEQVPKKVIVQGKVVDPGDPGRDQR